MSKHANKMGTIRKRSDGRWEARYTAPDGSRKSVYGKTQKAVSEALRAAQHDIDSGTWIEPSKMTMGEWFAVWLRDYQSHTTGRTLQTYASVVNKRLRPLFGEIMLSNFAPVHARRLVSTMKRDGLAPATIRHALAILRCALKAAVDDGLIKTNPVTNIKIPRVVQQDFTIIDREQIPAFVEAVKTTSCPDAMLFLLLTGVRSGEMRGLQWSDVDLDAATVYIQRQIYTPSRSAMEFRPPKDGEVRLMYVTPEVVDLLRRHRKQQAADRLRAGTDWIETDITRDLVFRRQNGDAITGANICNAIEAIRKALNLPTLRAHDLRHSYAVAALRAGVDVKTVQHNLGHKHASITLDTYAAYTDDAGKVAATKLSAYIADTMK